jgi:eukaryotic-like serine/threonine-protein kinase
MSLLIGTTLGDYRVEHVLGYGGMGEVYQGSSTLTSRKVAIKVLNADAAADPQARNGLLKEARSLEQLDHPNVVRLLHCGEDTARGSLYLVMELVTGGTLADLMLEQSRSQRPIAIALALDLVRQAAEGLAYAHQSIIHRDIKPANLLLQRRSSPTGALFPYTVKITDFGLARINRRRIDDGTPISRGFCGTLEYAAPEQFANQPLDGRSDIYSLGVVLFELLTGQLPFPVPSGDFTQARELHCWTTPPMPRELRPDIPADAEEIVLRCLEKDPGRRYSNAALLSLALQAALRRLPQRAAHPRATVVLRSTERIAEPSALPSLVPYIRIDDGSGHLQSLAMRERSLIVGRQKGCDLVLDSEQISRKHLRIERDGTVLRVVDLGSTNGTFLSGRRLIPLIAQAWPPGVEMLVGEHRLSLESRPSAIMPATLTQRPAWVRDGSLIGLALESGNATLDELHLTPGEPQRLTALIANLGQEPEHIGFMVEGLPEAWLSLPPRLVKVAPESIAQVSLTICVPQSPEHTAGARAVTMRAYLQRDPQVAAVIQPSCEVLPYISGKLTLAPQRSRGSAYGEHTLILRNDGNAPMSYTFSATASDPNHALDFLFALQPGTFTCTAIPGSANRVRLIVRSRGPHAGTGRHYNFTIVAHPADGSAPLTANGEFVHRESEHGPPLVSPGEEVFFQDGEALVTDRRVAVGTELLSVRAIASVGITTIFDPLRWALVVLFAALTGLALFAPVPELAGISIWLGLALAVIGFKIATSPAAYRTMLMVVRGMALLLPLAVIALEVTGMLALEQAAIAFAGALLSIVLLLWGGPRYALKLRIGHYSPERQTLVVRRRAYLQQIADAIDAAKSRNDSFET